MIPLNQHKLQQQPISNDPESKSLCSEAQHLLTSHPEHTMSLIELVHGMETDNEASLSVEELYKYLKKEPDNFMVNILRLI